MGRPAGRRNADYDDERSALLGRLQVAVLAPGGAALSFRELAAAADVSPATLRHYFQDRPGVLRAALAALGNGGAPYLRAVAEGPLEVGGPLAGPLGCRERLRASLAWLLDLVAEGWPRGVGAIHAFGLSAGLGDQGLGPAYLNEILEPTLQATEARLARHQAAGDMAAGDARHAALALLSPVVLALLHQDCLRGEGLRALALRPFLDDHLTHFVRAYGA